MHRDFGLTPNLLNINGEDILKNMHTNDIDFSAIVKYHSSKVGIITVGDPEQKILYIQSLRSYIKKGVM